MTGDPSQHRPHRNEREEPHELVAYDDEEALILCDRTNPRAWIRSDTVVTADGQIAAHGELLGLDRQSDTSQDGHRQSDR